MDVKGTMILDYVKMIRANRDKGWDKWLTDEDWKIIEGQVLSSQWYPYQSFRRIGFAVFKVIANSNLDVAREFGKFTMRNLLEIYKNILVPGDPASSVAKFAALRRTFFRGENITTTADESGAGWVRYRIVTPEEETDPERTIAFINQASGSLIEIVLQSGGKNVRAELKIGDGEYGVTVRWD